MKPFCQSLPSWRFGAGAGDSEKAFFRCRTVKLEVVGGILERRYRGVYWGDYLINGTAILNQVVGPRVLMHKEDGVVEGDLIESWSP